MQLGTSTIPLLPAVAVGAAVVLALLVCWGVSRARRVPVATTPDGDVETGPCAEDWTGEAAAGAADPPPVRSATVADAVAARGADTRPFPSVPDGADVPRRSPWADPAPDPAEPARTAAARTVHDPWAVPAEPDPWAAPAAPDPSADLAASDSTAELPAAGPPASGPSAADPQTAAHTAIPAGPPSRSSGSTAVPVGPDPSVDPPGADHEPPPVVGPPSPAVPEHGDAHRSVADRNESDEASTEPERDPRAASGTTVETASAGSAAAGTATADTTTAGTMPPPESDDPAERDASPEPPGDAPEAAEDAAGPERVAPDVAVEPGPVPPPWSVARSDPDGARSSDPAATDAAAPISIAVAHALAAREMQRARGVPTEDVVGPEETSPVPDARDRLLSVLLSDPVAALGAATELDDTRVRIDQLGAVLRRRRADLATAVHRLHASGLTGEQIGRLSGLDADDVRAILDRRAEEGASDR